MVEYTDTQKTICSQIQSFAKSLKGAFDTLDESKAEIKKSEAQWNEQNDGASTKGRLPTMLKAAKLSAVKGWSVKDIKAATTLARKSPLPGQNTAGVVSKTIDVFMSDLQVAMHPAVRNQFKAVWDAVEAAWTAEVAAKAADEDAEMPCKRYGSGKYKLIVKLCREAREDKEIKLRTAIQVRDHCIANLPSNLSNVDIAANKCATIAKLIAKLQAEYHYDKFQTIFDYLSLGSLATEMETSRQAAIAKQAKLDAAKAKSQVAQDATVNVVKPVDKANQLQAKIAAAKAEIETSASDETDETDEPEDDDNVSDLMDDADEDDSDEDESNDEDMDEAA